MPRAAPSQRAWLAKLEVDVGMAADLGIFNRTCMTLRQLGAECTSGVGGNSL